MLPHVEKSQFDWFYANCAKFAEGEARSCERAVDMCKTMFGLNKVVLEDHITKNAQFMTANESRAMI